MHRPLIYRAGDNARHFKALSGDARVNSFVGNVFRFAIDLRQIVYPISGGGTVVNGPQHLLSDCPVLQGRDHNCLHQSCSKHQHAMFDQRPLARNTTWSPGEISQYSFDCWRISKTTAESAVLLIFTVVAFNLLSQSRWCRKVYDVRRRIRIAEDVNIIPAERITKQLLYFFTGWPLKEDLDLMRVVGLDGVVAIRYGSMCLRFTSLFSPLALALCVFYRYGPAQEREKGLQPIVFANQQGELPMVLALVAAYVCCSLLVYLIHVECANFEILRLAYFKAGYSNFGAGVSGRGPQRSMSAEPIRYPYNAPSSSITNTGLNRTMPPAGVRCEWQQRGEARWRQQRNRVNHTAFVEQVPRDILTHDDLHALFHKLFDKILGQRGNVVRHATVCTDVDKLRAQVEEHDGLEQDAEALKTCGPCALICGFCLARWHKRVLAFLNSRRTSKSKVARLEKLIEQSYEDLKDVPGDHDFFSYAGLSLTAKCPPVKCHAIDAPQTWIAKCKHYFSLCSAAWVQRRKDTTGFVAFRSRLAHAIAVTMRLQEPQQGGLRVMPAPFPGDIIWTNMGITTWQRNVRGVISAFAMVLLLCLWGIIAVFLQQIANLETLQFSAYMVNKIPLLGVLSGGVDSILSWAATQAWWSHFNGFLHSLMLVVLVYVLPPIVRLWLRKYGAAQTESEVMRKSLAVCYTFNLVTIYVTAFSGSFWIGGTPLEMTEKVLGVVAGNLNLISSYFICFIITKVAVRMFVYLLRPYVVLPWLAHCLHKTFVKCRTRSGAPAAAPLLSRMAMEERDRCLRTEQRMLSERPCLDSILLDFAIILALCMLYCVIAPVIVLLAVVVFYMYTSALRFNLVFINTQHYDSGGLFVRALISITFSSLLAALLVLQAFLLSTQDRLYLGLTCTVLLHTAIPMLGVLVLYAWYNMQRRFDLACDSVSVQTAVELDTFDVEDDAESLPEREYVDPCIKRARQLLQNEPHPQRYYDGDEASAAGVHFQPVFVQRRQKASDHAAAALRRRADAAHAEMMIAKDMLARDRHWMARHIGADDSRLGQTSDEQSEDVAFADFEEAGLAWPFEGGTCPRSYQSSKAESSDEQDRFLGAAPAKPPLPPPPKTAQAKIMWRGPPHTEDVAFADFEEAGLAWPFEGGTCPRSYQSSKAESSDEQDRFLGAAPAKPPLPPPPKTAQAKIMWRGPPHTEEDRFLPQPPSPKAAPAKMMWMGPPPAWMTDTTQEDRFLPQPPSPKAAPAKMMWRGPPPAWMTDTTQEDRFLPQPPSPKAASAKMMWMGPPPAWMTDTTQEMWENVEDTSIPKPPPPKPPPPPPSPRQSDAQRHTADDERSLDSLPPKPPAAPPAPRLEPASAGITHAEPLLTHQQQLEEADHCELQQLGRTTSEASDLRNQLEAFADVSRTSELRQAQRLHDEYAAFFDKHGERTAAERQVAELRATLAVAEREEEHAVQDPAAAPTTAAPPQENSSSRLDAVSAASGSGANTAAQSVGTPVSRTAGTTDTAAAVKTARPSAALSSGSAAPGGGVAQRLVEKLSKPPIVEEEPASFAVELNPASASTMESERGHQLYKRVSL